MSRENKSEFLRGSAMAAVLALAAGTAATSAQAAVVHSADANTTLLWHLNETNLTNTVNDALDSSTNAIHGAVFNDGLNNTPKTISAGSAGVTSDTGDGAYNFYGRSVSNRNVIRSANLPSMSGAFTLEMWIKIPDFSSYNAPNVVEPTTGAVLAYKRANSGGGTIDWSLGLLPTATSGSMQFRLYKGTGGQSTAAVQLQANTWYYIALTSTPTTGGMADYNIYYAVDGASALTQAGSYSLAQAATASGQTDALFIGGYTTGQFNNFNGFMDEVHFSNSARSQQYMMSVIAIPEPASVGLLGAAVTLPLLRRRRSR